MVPKANVKSRRKKCQADSQHVLGKMHLPGENLPGVKPAMKDLDKTYPLNFLKIVGKILILLAFTHAPTPNWIPELLGCGFENDCFFVFVKWHE